MRQSHEKLISLVPWLLLTLIGCGRAERQVSRAGPGESVEGTYDERMTAALGVSFSSADVVEAAVQARKVIVDRMNLLAEAVAPGAEWPEVFARLKLEHPVDVAALLATYRTELTAAREFVRDHRLASTPEDGPEVVELGNFALRQNYPLAIYLRGRLGITTTAGREPDPGYLVNHCDVCIPPLAVHEGYPGHHLAFARLARNLPRTGPRSPTGANRIWPPVSAAGLDGFWVEGWGLYAELLMLEEGYYSDAARELGAWRMMLLRVVRAEVDARLHNDEISPLEASRIYREELQMSPAAAETEVRRHLAAPQTKATYFVGMLQLLELRRQALEQAPALTLEALHDAMLEDAAPIAEIARSRFGVELGPPGVADLAGSPLFAPD